MESTYKPNVGLLFWFQILILFVIALALLVIKTSVVNIAVLLVLLLIVTYSMLTLLKTSYTLEDDKIVIQNALRKFDIPYGSVKKIVSTNKFLRNLDILVLSMDRIEISFGESGNVSISPRGKQDVLSSLRSECPDAEYEEDIKVRKEWKIVDGRLVPPPE